MIMRRQLQQLASVQVVDDGEDEGLGYYATEDAKKTNRILKVDPFTAWDDSFNDAFTSAEGPEDVEAIQTERFLNETDVQKKFRLYYDLNTLAKHIERTDPNDAFQPV